MKYHFLFRRSITSQQIQFPKPHAWNRAVSDAEKLVGFPTSLLSLQSLMNDDVTSVASHVRKLMGSDHPILRTLKRLIYHDKNNLQVKETKRRTCPFCRLRLTFF